MLVRFMQLFAILLSVGALAAVIFSFSFVKLPKIKQQPDRNTGYPTWHGKIEGYNSDQNDAVNTLTVVLLAITGFIGLKIVNNPPTKPKFITHFYTITDDSDAEVTGTPTIGFNRLLVLYVWVTCATIFFSIFVDVGKLFNSVGILHNSTEIAILTLIGNGGRIKGGSLFAWLLFYILTTSAGIIFLEYPKDAALFKFQGLVMDIALVIEFTRIYISTKEHIREVESDAPPPLTADDDDNKINNIYDTYFPVLPTTIEYPRHLSVLLLASGLHLAGNIFNILFFSKNTPLLIFELSYTTVFPIYAYFVCLDVTAAASVLPQKRIYLPYTPTWKAILIAINAITLSLFFFRLSFLFSNNSD